MRIFLSTLIGLSVAALSACATPRLTELADGSAVYQVDCDGTPRGLNYCLEKAGRTCGAQAYILYADDGRRIAFGGDAQVSGEVAYKDFPGDRSKILFRCEDV
ncbi:MAG: hypothetical protein AAGL69_03700 [Pseudomonadota bacterium]